jgi:hypothetical protein
MQKYVFIALIVHLAGCASYVPLSHSSTAPVLRARLEEPDVKIYLQHLENKYQHYVFDLEIDNQGAEAIYVSPQQISFYFSDHRFPRRELLEEGEKYTRLKRKQFVRKPIEVKELYEQKERSRASVATVFALVSVGMMVYDEVKDSKDRSRSHVTEKDVVRQQYWRLILRRNLRNRRKKTATSSPTKFLPKEKLTPASENAVKYFYRLEKVYAIYE